MKRTSTSTTWHQSATGGEVHLRCNWRRKPEDMVKHGWTEGDAGVSLEFPFSNWLIKKRKLSNPCYSMEHSIVQDFPRIHK